MAKELCLILNPRMSKNNFFHLVNHFEVWDLPREQLDMEFPSDYPDIEDIKVLVANRRTKSLTGEHLRLYEERRTRVEGIEEEWIDAPVEGLLLSTELPEDILRLFQCTYLIHDIEFAGETRKVLRTVSFDFKREEWENATGT